MEPVFKCLSQALRLVLPVVFMKITSLLLASVHSKPVMRRAVGCLPEPLCECLEICLLGAGDKNAVSLRPLSLLPLQHQRRQEQGLGFSLFCFASGSPVCVVYTRGGSTAKAVRRWWAAVGKILFSAEAAHLAASPDPASIPKESLQISLLVRRPLMGKSLGDKHWPYLLPVVTARVGIVYLFLLPFQRSIFERQICDSESWG